MLDNLAKTVTRFFGITAGTLSSLGAVLTAVGYLAERSHLIMLGFTTVPVDLNQYLYTGALFLAILPVIIIITPLHEWWGILLLLILIIWRLSLQNAKMRYLNDTFFDRSKSLIINHRIAFLVLLVMTQVLILNWMVNATLIGNLLFENIFEKPETLTFFSIKPDNLKYLIFSRVEDILRSYFVQLFLFTLVIGLALRQVITINRKSQETKMALVEKVWLGINLFLITTQVILLPVNFGALVLSKQYQEVKVQFKEFEQKKVLPPKTVNTKLNQSPLFVNKIRDQVIELDELPFVFNLNAVPVIFIDPDQDSLFYSVYSDAPDIAEAAIRGSVLKVSALSEGNTKITVTANDGKGETAATDFSIKVIEEFDIWGVDVENPISDRILIVGEHSFVRDLESSPTVFSPLDADSLYLTFRASSNAPEVAKLTISGSQLMVEPVSKGNANITVSANDGFGQSVSTAFRVTTLDSNLTWPNDKRLLLMHQSSNVFYLYSRREKRIWYIRNEDIRSMVYYGLVHIFQTKKK